MIGLGCRKQDFVDPRPKQRTEKCAAADPKAIENARERGLKIIQRFGPGVESSQRVYEHDLTIETSEMVAEEGPYHHTFISLITALHHRPQRAIRRRHI